MMISRGGGVEIARRRDLSASASDAEKLRNFGLVD